MSFLSSVVSQSSWFCSNTCFHSGHQQVANPIIPYVGPIISGGLKPGMALYIQGIVPDNANQFSINFQTGQNKYDDIAFHFNPWIGQHVYLNSFQNGNWAVKDCVPDESFTNGAAFNMFIVINTDGYENWRRPGFTEQAVTSTGRSFSNFLPLPSEVSHQVIQPVVPHVGKIRDRLKPEMAVFFQGALPAHPKEFEINFQTGQSDSDDIAFHFNPRIGQYVSLNSFRNGSWEKEERVSDELFTKEATFYMFVVIGLEGYEVYVNGLQLCRFNHRIPLEDISTISIYGDVTIPIYGFIDNWSRSFTFTDFLKITGMGSSFPSLLPVISEISHPVILPTIPYVGTIRGGLKPDMAVFFQGTLPAHAKKFAINFQTGQSDRDDIAFHFNPHIGQYVCLNSYRNASWEQEESTSEKLFSKGAAFNMFIIINSEGYEVHMNGVQLCMFKHRIPLENISTLAILGDISIAIFSFIDALPYIGSFKEEIRPDMALLFHGVVSEHGKSFEINLLTGDSGCDDVAFHISPRIGKSVALNSFINGSWQTEEYASDDPFSKGASFQMFFIINSEGYEVLVNNLKHCTFKHRIPLEKISTLGIRGDVSINYFGFVEELPYRGPIPEGLRTDMAVDLQGALPAHAKEFTINFQTGKNDGDDIAFHINPRIGDLVALNSFRNGSWETEEHASVTAFAKEAALNMNIAINSEGYEVYVNGLQHCTFKHRIPLEKVSTLGIFGDVNIKYFGFVEELSYVGVIPQGLKTDMGVMFQVSLPADANDAVIFKSIHHETENLNKASMIVELNEIKDTSLTSGSLIDVPAEISHPVSNPELPYVGVIPQRIKTDMGIMFQVSLPADANEFTINFQTGESDGDDIAFHINPRISDLVALNSFRNGSWETEEHASVTAFAKEAALNMNIAINSEGYEVYVNGLQHCTFKHRIPLEKVSTLGIFGDVNIKYFGFVENWSNSSIFKKINEIQDKSITTGSLTDVRPEISPATSNPELSYVGVIPQGLKTDMGVMFQVSLPADANDAVNFKSVHLESENLSESSMIVGINKIQDTSLTSGSLIDVPAEISHQISTPELPYVGVIPQGLKTDMGVMFQVSLPADANDAVNIKSIHHGSEKLSESSMIMEMNEIKDTPLTSGSLIDIPAEISHPISNPEIPYVGAIPGGLKTDMAVVFQGALPADSKEFTVNFQTGKNDGDIAFHINPRIGDLVALNSFINDTWETEEHASVTAFAKEAAFSMNIAINSDGYEVYVNGLQHCTFKHRIPLEKVSTLAIFGDVNIKYFGFVENWSRSSLALEEHKELTVMTDTSVALLPITPDKLALPFVSTIPGGIRADMAILFSGTVFADSNEFEINFQTSQSSDDIAFNINPQIVRFLVLSSLRKGNWESEDLDSDKGAAFNMFVVIRLEGYEVFVNGLQYCMFKHCIPSETISLLGIRGDVFVNFIGLIDNWSSCSMVMESSYWRPIPISSELSHPFNNLVLPYVGVIPGKARPDMAILFQGALPVDANEFTINFQTGDSDSDDITFHINPQLGRHVAINSFRNGSWETEESISDKPFTKGASFNMFVVIKSEHYEVYVNGLELCTFKHRIPVENISALEISGDVSINFIGFIEARSTFTSTLSIPSEVSNPIIQPTLPFMGRIPGGLKPDTAVFFQGAVPNNAKLFEINFHTGQSYGDGIAFHFNPRITVKYVYMNTLRNGKWEMDESVYDKPIPKGTSFSLLILIKSEGYEVYVNGLWYWLFKHRMPLEQVSTLGIRGDVFISVCGFINNWSKSSLCAEQSKINGLGSSFLKMLPIPAELLNPVIQPAIPYTGPISGGIKPGMALFIQGTVNPSANQFGIDFKAGPTNTDDIPFTLNPRIGQYLYMNTFSNGLWQNEQLVVDKPFTRGGTFSILIVFNSVCVEVYVNGMKHCTYMYRMHLGKVSTLYIWGDACIHYFGFTYNWSRSPFFKKQLKITDKGTSATSPLFIPPEISNAVIQPKIPHTGPISGQLRPGMALYVRGAVLTDDCQLVISFQNGQSDNADIAFLFNPQFDQYLYLNSYKNNVWDKEELVYDRPFIRGEHLIVVIVINNEGYEVYVNGTRHCLFKHRVPVQNVNALGIWGGVSVHFYGFIEDWSASSFFKEQSKTTGVGSSSSGMLVIPTEISNPVIQPQIPYTGPVSGEIKPGMALYVEGTVPANGNQFSINILAGHSKTDDVLLTFNPRIGHYLYLNSFRNGVWEKEQLAPDKPFAKGTAFNLLISVSSQGYEMYVNGLKHCTFAHRIPFERITALHIWGDVNINFFGYIDNWRRSYIFRDQPNLTDVGSSFTSLLPAPSDILQPVIQPTLPYVTTVKGGMKPDMAVLIQGVLPAHAQSFEINFKTGESDTDDIAFHLNPRIGQYVYLNSFRNGSWEKEECVSDKPFTKGAGFYLFIVINSDNYEVFVNGLRQCTFNHRIPLEKVSTLGIRGEVSKPTYGFIDNWSSLYLCLDQSRITGTGDTFSSLLANPSDLSHLVIQPLHGMLRFPRSRHDHATSLRFVCTLSPPSFLNKHLNENRCLRPRS
ncbi:hypothetical protein QTP70_030375 [Hemibagrus guttatus]|uniref:Galectin domain-containing protein n=1 Tax=Hemibagrus guttatus TaxID=175788 RepID=A0AAE0RDB9_9TELE|nr:hypothetical protein QTP70_030375 [Hemibagrus guttatus]